MNQLNIIGNLTRDPKTRQINTSKGPVNVCDFSVAVSDRRRKDENGQPLTTFFNCTAWNGLADVVARYATKGTKVRVTGPVSCRTYQANDGTTKASLEVTADDFEFCSSGNRAEQTTQAEKPQEEKKDFTTVQSDELPF